MKPVSICDNNREIIMSSLRIGRRYRVSVIVDAINKKQISKDFLYDIIEYHLDYINELFVEASKTGNIEFMNILYHTDILNIYYNNSEAIYKANDYQTVKYIQSLAN